MTAAETIAAAIRKLEAAKSTEDGDEQAWRYEFPNPLAGATLFDANDYVIADGMYEPDAQTAVMLHRTIDAQLDTLRQAQRALDGTSPAIAEVLTTSERFGPTFALARAILGESS